MKKHAFKPGFEFIFSLCILAILGLPPLVFAQTTKDLQITIKNGDTIINGKNIKDLSASDRKDALKNINQITVISSDDKADSAGRHAMIGGGNMKHGRHLRILKFDDNGKDSTMLFNRGDEPRHKMPKHDEHFNRENDGHMAYVRRNTQNFVYTNIDNEGIVTHVSYRVSEHPEMLDYDAGKQGDTQMDMLDLTDLTMVPEFASAKTMLMFSLPAKTVAEVQFKDSKGTLLWSAKALNGQFSKSFPLGLNGSYYLQVKQGAKVAVKKIVKE